LNESANHGLLLRLENPEVRRNFPAPQPVFPHGSATALLRHMLTAPCDDRSLAVSRMIPEGEPGEKETRTSKSLPQVKTNVIASQKRIGKKAKLIRCLKNSALPEPPLNKSTESFAALCVEHFTKQKMCDRPQPVWRIMPGLLFCTAACHRNH